MYVCHTIFSRSEAVTCRESYIGTAVHSHKQTVLLLCCEMHGADHSSMFSRSIICNSLERISTTVLVNYNIIPKRSGREDPDDSNKACCILTEPSQRFKQAKSQPRTPPGGTHMPKDLESSVRRNRKLIVPSVSHTGLYLLKKERWCAGGIRFEQDGWMDKGKRAETTSGSSLSTNGIFSSTCSAT